MLLFDLTFVLRLFVCFFFKLKLSAHYDIIDLQMLIDRPQHQKILEREKQFSHICIFMWLVVNGARTERK